LAVRRGWVDTPNARSSHRRVVPRGAGIVIVILVMLTGIFYAAQPPLIYLSLLPGLGIAAIGWWDDVRNLPAAPRFLLYWLCALSTLVAMGSWNLVTAPDVLILLTVSLALLWSINLYNFMDGIDGIAAFEAIFVLTGSLLLSPASLYANQLQAWIYCIIAALTGFLFWNFPTAKVFMGDVGSAFLGFLIGLLALWSHAMHGPSIAVWLILLGAFIVDTSYTLAVRVGSRQPWYQAHSSHAYQRLSQRLQSHPKTVAALMGVNIAWLLPWAWALQNNWVTTATALLIAYVPLLAICYALKAGIPTKSGV
jgi:Fuc2NAc and GlcNAc transferase